MPFHAEFYNFHGDDYKNGALYLSAGDGKVAWVDVRDIAAVNVDVLLNPEIYRNQTLTITVPIDPAAATDNLYYILEQSESRGLIVADGTDSGNMLSTASAAKSDIPLLEHIISITGSSDPELVSWEEIIVGGKDVNQEALLTISNAVNPEDPMALMYTSGTTGRPKGVVLDHLGLINKSMVSTERQGISTDDRLCLFCV